MANNDKPPSPPTRAQAFAVSVAHLARSAEYLRDAYSGAQSHRGQSDSAFDAGYVALLSMLSLAERKSPEEHPNEQVINVACARLNLDAATGLDLLNKRYSPEGPTQAAVIAWAEGVRARVLACASDNLA